LRGASAGETELLAAVVKSVHVAGVAFEVSTVWDLLARCFGCFPGWGKTVCRRRGWRLWHRGTSWRCVASFANAAFCATYLPPLQMLDVLYNLMA